MDTIITESLKRCYSEDLEKKYAHMTRKVDANEARDRMHILAHAPSTSATGTMSNFPLYSISDHPVRGMWYRLLQKQLTEAEQELLPFPNIQPKLWIKQDVRQILDYDTVWKANLNECICLENMTILLFKGFWTPSDVRFYSDYMFIFGDNDVQRGKKGQAIIRDEPNAFGVPTKKRPSFDSDAYYTDAELERNKSKIDRAFFVIMTERSKYKGIFLPENGLGTGLAKLQQKAPLTLKYIEEKISSLN